MFTSNNEYTVLDRIAYQETITKSRNKVISHLESLQGLRQQSKDKQVDWIIQQLVNTPYCLQGAMGEGDWQPDSFTYQPGALHVKQDPVYRLDTLDCQTLIQVVLALLHAETLNDFETNIIKSAYGAAHEDAKDMVRYYNRNNFIEGDWNRVNRAHGFIENATGANDLCAFTKNIQILLERQQWFKLQTQNSELHVRVLADKDGHAMVNRFKQSYPTLPCPHFQQETITMDYLPKEAIATESGNEYRPNMSVLSAIPTPAIVEFIRDSDKWIVNNTNIKTLIGTECCVSHVGLLYQRTFQKGELIYLKMTPYLDEHNLKQCTIEPIYSQHDHNTQLMLAHATNARPDGLVFFTSFNDNQNQYHVSAMAPTDGRAFVPLNRVETIPLYHYLTDYQYGRSTMQNTSVLGIHIEKILSSHFQ